MVPPALQTLVDRFDSEAFDAPKGSALIHLVIEGDFAWDVAIIGDSIVIREADGTEWDAELSADVKTWEKIAQDINAGMEAFQAGKLWVRKDLHLGIGFLAATSGMEEEGRHEFSSVETSQGRISFATAGEGDPVICLHGLGATKASFMTTIAALNEDRRVIAMDFPGFGDSSKPLGAKYDAPYFAGVVTEVMDALDIESADIIGNSMGGRVAIELGLLYPERVGGIVLLAPALAWLKDRRWRWLLSPPLPFLGLIQPAPRVITEPLVRSLVPGGKDGWTAAGVDEFLRAFLTPRGRVAFYESARNIYLDEPHGENGLWTRLEGLKTPALFVWGRQDTLVPIGFRKHVENSLPSARHLELDCGHVPQLEEPVQTHGAITEFLDSVHASV